MGNRGKYEMEHIIIKSNKNILPMNYPFITSMPFYANLLSILLNYEKTFPWICTYFIPLQISKQLENPGLQFCVGWESLTQLKNCPFINFHLLPRDIVKKWDSITDFIIDRIDTGYYLWFEVDTYYIPCYSTYEKEHFSHDIFIYGYDKDKQLFHVADFFTNYKYEYSTTSFEEMENAHAGYKRMQSDLSNKWEDWFKGIISLHYNKYAIYNFDIDRVKDLIEDYRTSTDGFNRLMFFDRYQYRSGYLFGIEVYEMLKKSLKTTIEETHRFYLKSFHLLWDHKKVLLFLINYLGNNGYLNDAYLMLQKCKEMEHVSLLIRNRLIKYLTTNDKKILEKSIDSLSYLATEEYDIFGLIMKNINSTPIIPSIANTKVDNISYAILYSNGWKNNFYSDETRFIESRFTNSSNAFAQFAFLGTSIRYLATKNKYSGLVDIYIDKIKDKTIDLYSDNEMLSEEVYSKENLPYGYHIIRIVCTGEKNIQSLDRDISVDGFECSSENNTGIIQSQAEFISEDSETQGSWISDYGTGGYIIFNEAANMPSYSQLFYNGFYITKPINTCDTKVLQNLESPDNRVASCLYNFGTIHIELIIAGNVPKKIGFYFFDWEERSGFEIFNDLKIDVIDADNGCVLDSRYLNTFKSGIYLNYFVKGHIILEISNNSSLEGAVSISGIFFDRVGGT